MRDAARMMSRDLQTIVDDLATTLQRPVGIDDAQFRSQAYSAHLEDADPVRLASILRRQAPPDVTSWLIGELRVHEARRSLRIEPNAELGMAARVCIPIRFQDLLLGYIWLIDGDPRLDARQVAEAERSAAEAATVLYGNRFLESADREREHALMTELLTGGAQRAVAAAHQLLAARFFAPSARYAVVVVRPCVAAAMGDDGMRVRLTAAAERTRRSLDAGGTLTVSLTDTVAVLVSSDRAGAADVLHRVAGELTADAAGDACVGVGGWVERLANVSESLAQARLAADIAARLPELNGSGDWERLGAFQILGRIAPEPWMWELLRPLLDDAHPDLVTTLESYLRHAGNSTATAAELHLHRTTLYHRLRKIERLCGVDLEAGEDRLRMDLAMRLRRLAVGPGPA